MIAAQDVGANRGVRPHDRRLFGAETPAFAEQAVGHADLPDVVKRRGAPNQVDLLGFEPEGLGDLGGEHPDANGVTSGAVVAVLGGRRQVPQDFHAGVFELLRPAVDRFAKGAILFPHVLKQQPGFELVAHSQHELGRIERLADEVARAEGQGAAAGVVGRVAADDQHRQTLIANPRLQRLDDVVPIAIRHVQVRDDEVGNALEELALELAGVGESADTVIAGTGQDLCD